MSKVTKLRISVIVLIALLGIIVWHLTYNIHSRALDDSIKPMTNDLIEELNEMNVQQVLVDAKEISNGEADYIDLQDILDYDFKSGDVAKVIVIYDNETKANKEAYISVNTDEEEVRVVYKDGDYGQIKLPQNVDLSRSEFVEKVNDIVEEEK